MTARAAVTAFILAGGRGRRLGGADKALVDLAGTPLIGHVVARLAPQVDRIVINANGDPARFAAFGRRVVGDDASGNCRGVFAGLAAAATVISAPFVADGLLLTAPTDTPFLPADLVDRLATALAATAAPLAYAESGGIAHPTVALWTRASLAALVKRLGSGDAPRLQTLLPLLGGVAVSFSVGGVDPFFNVNTPADRAAAALVAASIAFHRSE